MAGRIGVVHEELYWDATNKIIIINLLTSIMNVKELCIGVSHRLSIHADHPDRRPAKSLIPGQASSADSTPSLESFLAPFVDKFH